MPKSAFFSDNVPTAPQLSSSVVQASASAKSAQAHTDYFMESRAVTTSLSSLRSGGHSLNNGWRFPSSRKFLWDRTPMGATEYLQPREHLPTILIPSNLHQEVLQHSSNGVGKVLARFSCSNRHTLEVALHGAASCSYNPAEDHATIHVAVCKDTRDQRQQDVSNLKHLFQHGLDRRGAVQLSQRLALTCSLHPTGGSSATLTATVLMPLATLTMTPLYSKRLCDVPLAHTLAATQPAGGALAAQMGYLTMDQARSVLPLLPDDPTVFSVPLVGLWLRGIRSIDHPMVYSACLKFCFSSVLPDRAVQSDGTFLVLMFSGESPIPQCFDARFPDVQQQQDSGLQLLPHTLHAELAGQTSTPLALKPVQDTMGLSVALRPTSPVPGGRPGSMQPPGSPFRNRAVGAPAGGFATESELDMAILRGSGSKLMTSPSKAMKVIAPPKQAASFGGSGGSAGYGPDGRRQVDTGADTRQPQQDSPPKPRSSWVPTPFGPGPRPGPEAPGAMPRDPRLAAAAGGAGTALAGAAPAIAPYHRSSTGLSSVMATPAAGLMRSQSQQQPSVYGLVQTPGPQFVPWGSSLATAPQTAASETGAQGAGGAGYGMHAGQGLHRPTIDQSLDQWLRASATAAGLGIGSNGGVAASAGLAQPASMQQYMPPGDVGPGAGMPATAGRPAYGAAAVSTRYGHTTGPEQQQHAEAARPQGMPPEGAQPPPAAGLPGPGPPWQAQGGYGACSLHADPRQALQSESNAMAADARNGYAYSQLSAASGPTSKQLVPAHLQQALEGMPTDPLTLQLEVLRLRTQVEQLQGQLQAALAAQLEGQHAPPPQALSSSSAVPMPESAWGAGALQQQQPANAPGVAQAQQSQGAAPAPTHLPQQQQALGAAPAATASSLAAGAAQTAAGCWPAQEPAQHAAAWERSFDRCAGSNPLQELHEAPQEQEDHPMHSAYQGELVPPSANVLAGPSHTGGSSHPSLRLSPHQQHALLLAQPPSQAPQGPPSSSSRSQGYVVAEQSWASSSSLGPSSLQHQHHQHNHLQRHPSGAHGGATGAAHGMLPPHEPAQSVGLGGLTATASAALQQQQQQQQQFLDDRTDHMSVSGRSDRGSIWSMASLKSSVISGYSGAGTMMTSVSGSAAAAAAAVAASPAVAAHSVQRRRARGRRSSSTDDSDMESIASMDGEGSAAYPSQAQTAVRASRASALAGDVAMAAAIVNVGAGSVRSSVDIVRTKYVPLDDDSDSSDSDREAQLMHKYGIRR